MSTHVCPLLIIDVIGPPLNYAPPTTSEELTNGNFTTAILWRTLSGGKDSDVPETVYPSYTDVRDLADALFRIVDQKASGRYIVANGPFDFQELADRARELYPDLPIPVGDPSYHAGQKTYILDGSKIAKELGLKYSTKDDLIKSSIEQFEKLGAYKN